MHFRELKYSLSFCITITTVIVIGTVVLTIIISTVFLTVVIVCYPCCLSLPIICIILAVVVVI